LSSFCAYESKNNVSHIPLAQEESRSISENVTWGQRKRFTVDFLTKKQKVKEGEVPPVAFKAQIELSTQNF
jgi:hypothetical protein